MLLKRFNFVRWLHDIFSEKHSVILPNKFLQVLRIFISSNRISFRNVKTKYPKYPESNISIKIQHTLSVFFLPIPVRRYLVEKTKSL